jgi:hypothetical protein
MIRLRPQSLPLSRFEAIPEGRERTPDQMLIRHMVEMLPPGPRFCVEFGARDGTWGLQVRELLENLQFGGLLIEGDPEMAEHLQRRFEDRPEVRAVQSFITAENIERLFEDGGVPAAFEFMLIDIDGNDWHVWNEIRRFRPSIVCIEYNPGHAPPARFRIDYDPAFQWSGDDYYGASFRTMVELASEKGYRLAHVSSNGDNLYFVADEVADRFETAAPGEEDRWYQVPQYGIRGRAPNGKGHPISHRNSTPMQRFVARLRWLLLAPGRSFFKTIDRLEQARV